MMTTLKDDTSHVEIHRMNLFSFDMAFHGYCVSKTSYTSMYGIRP